MGLSEAIKKIQKRKEKYTEYLNASIAGTPDKKAQEALIEAFTVKQEDLTEILECIPNIGEPINRDVLIKSSAVYTLLMDELKDTRDVAYINRTRMDILEPPKNILEFNPDYIILT